MDPAGADLVIRPVEPGDAAAIERLLGGLDLESRYRRWFTGALDVHSAADWALHPERQSAVGLVALVAGELVGHGALVPAGDGKGEVAFEVAAGWRRHGVAGRLLEALAEAGRALGLDTIHAEVLPSNADMLAVLREHGPTVERRDGTVVTLELALSDALRRPPGADAVELRPRRA